MGKEKEKEIIIAVYFCLRDKLSGIEDIQGGRWTKSTIKLSHIQN